MINFTRDQTPLIGILLRFRRRPIPISGDIEKMYHQVAVPPHQQPLLSFLWQDPGSSKKVKAYQMVVHVFGATSSIKSCIYALIRTIEDFGHLYSIAASHLTGNVYVENCLDSVESEEEAVRLRRREVEMFVEMRRHDKPTSTGRDQNERVDVLFSSRLVVSRPIRKVQFHRPQRLLPFHGMNVWD